MCVRIPEKQNDPESKSYGYILRVKDFWHLGADLQHLNVTVAID